MVATNSSDFSGKGAYFMYDTIHGYNCTLRAHADIMAKLSEAIFHGIWGTYGEDFGVFLGQITNHQNWYQRHEMSVAYAKAGEIDRTVCLLPNYTKHAKLVQANAGKYGSGTVPWACSRPVFSGKRKRIFGATFEEIMTTGSIQATGQASTIGLTMYLTKLKDSLMRDRAKYTDVGTVSWHASPCVFFLWKSGVWSGGRGVQS